MIDVGLQLSVGLPRKVADDALLFARSGLPVDVRGASGGRVTIDPAAQRARVENGIDNGAFCGIAEMPASALVACFDNFSYASDAASIAIIGLQFPVQLTLSQGIALLRAIERAEELVIDAAGAVMTVGPDFIDVKARVAMPVLDPDTRKPVVGGDEWFVDGSFHIGGQARTDLLNHLDHSIRRERAKN